MYNSLLTAIESLAQSTDRLADKLDEVGLPPANTNRRPLAEKNTNIQPKLPTSEQRRIVNSSNAVSVFHNDENQENKNPHFSGIQKVIDGIGRCSIKEERPPIKDEPLTEDAAALASTQVGSKKCINQALKVIEKELNYYKRAEESQDYYYHSETKQTDHMSPDSNGKSQLPVKYSDTVEKLQTMVTNVMDYAEQHQLSRGTFVQTLLASINSVLVDTPFYVMIISHKQYKTTGVYDLKNLIYNEMVRWTLKRASHRFRVLVFLSGYAEMEYLDNGYENWGFTNGIRCGLDLEKITWLDKSIRHTDTYELTFSIQKASMV
ncbi:unnamed protein product [Ambrosiozyma monospora]|uniref:Unnamed protein product n=1 Tax=Ambrosiozyma monospora TaxID=43982 RepID=A0ACB5TSM2_AMBMO|nr:unnamed protein product [Ambrosiozyma monospora]